MTVDPREILLVSANAFDVDGADSAGLPTVWVNRKGSRYDGVGDPPSTVIDSLTKVPGVLGLPG